MGFDMDEIFSYRTVKVVRIKDRRLGIIHHAFRLAIVLFILQQILNDQLYLKKEPPVGGSVITSLRLSPNLNQSDPEPYYCSDSAVTGCVYWDSTQAFVPELGGGFLTTRVNVTQMGFNNTSNTTCSGQIPRRRDCLPVSVAKNVTNLYVADVETMTLMIEHTVKGFTTGIAKSNKMMKGELVSTNGTVIREWYPSGSSSDSMPDISKYSRTTSGDMLTVKEFLEAAGLASLDEIIDKSGATLRYTGFVVIIFIEYENRPSNPEDLLYRYRINRIKGGEGKREEYFADESAPAGWNQYKKYGIQLRFVQTGTIGEFSIMALLTNLAGAVALLSISTTIVDLLMLYVLPQRYLYEKAKYESTAFFSDIRNQQRQTKNSVEGPVSLAPERNKIVPRRNNPDITNSNEFTEKV